VNLALSVFDVFAHAIPGSLYLGLTFYALWRMRMTEVILALSISGAVTAVVLAFASYLLGHATYGAGRWISRVSRTSARPDRVRAEMRKRSPDARDRHFMDRDPFELLARLELEHPTAAAEVSRLRASSLMLRSCTPALLLIFVMSVVEAALGSSGWRCAGIATLAVILAVACARRGRVLADWAHMKTLELAYWAIPDSDFPDATSPQLPIET